MNVQKDTSPVHFTFNGSNGVRLNVCPGILHLDATTDAGQHHSTLRNSSYYNPLSNSCTLY